MMRTSLLSLLAICCLACSWPAQAAPAAPARTLAEQVEDFYRRETQGPALPFKEKAAAVTRGYAALSAGWQGELGGYTDADLASMFRATYLAAYYTFDTGQVRRLRALFDELARRGVASATQRWQLQESLIGARMLDEAQAFSKAHPEDTLQALPEFASKPGSGRDGASEWLVGENERKLVRNLYAVERGVRIVVVTHPSCRFSQDAVRDIYADPVLAKAFSGHGKWLAPQSGRLDFDLMQQWNREHPQAPIAVAYRQSDWPMLDYWGTPTFYILKDGKVEARIVGWSGPKRLALEAALRELGLL